ncbi:LuxR family transcriptional regulator [Rhizobium rhizosphaerae]|uniref:LuxR family transcriptional regulator n=1 Tax=Xaviernesmea rhizosphaerae TaxID=1672749 RepID=A0A1Q9AQ30_9HYPH|nr:LuxR family transcriptional regulator [Xaviernesmea rhizosphaerae]OLP57524.1 LuxR family transcriptional regulator [Xaviernesmea rhizosphaerae]OQP84120.1 LuxR family transcriptional regulator [Xaviernesmea rhizosphaerae]
MDIIEIEERFAAGDSLSGQIDTLFSAMQAFGFDTLIYDYTPVRYDLDGRLMMPTVLELRNIDETMRDYWFGRGYFRHDPVQHVALGTTAPFFWNYDPKAETRIRAFMNEDTACVADFLAERGLTAGVTVPVHLPGGDYATVTGIRAGDPARLEREARLCLGEFSLMAHLFQRAVGAQVARQATGLARLTARERECLRHSADGLSAKEISRLIDRSVPTVVMHLNAATRKLGAKNRTQAVARAAHFRLLDPPHAS